MRGYSAASCRVSCNVPPSRRETESHINSFPNFKAKIQDGEGSENTFDVHFVALFSEKEDAVPLVMTHGWPGSFPFPSITGF